MLLLRRPRAARQSFWCGNGRLIGCLRRHGREACVLSEIYVCVLSRSAKTLYLISRTICR